MFLYIVYISQKVIFYRYGYNASFDDLFKNSVITELLIFTWYKFILLYIIFLFVIYFIK